MEQFLQNLFSQYLSEQKTPLQSEWEDLAKQALKKEKELRNNLTQQQTQQLEELLELMSQIHYIEVKEAFGYACKLGANASKELLI